MRTTKMLRFSRDFGVFIYSPQNVTSSAFVSMFILLYTLWLPFLGQVWHPQDSISESSSEPSDPLKDSSPWTYENESLNPTLAPSNSQIRASDARRRRTTKNAIPVAPSLPHNPDYQEQYESEQYSETSEGSVDEQYFQKSGQLRVRRGSEGYEVQPAAREEMLQQYLENLGEEPGRYLRYIPQVEDGDESNFEDEDDDNVPLASHAKIVGGQ